MFTEIAFVQVLNVSINHWVTVSTISCPPGVINVYDSMHLETSTSLKKPDMMHSDKKAISIRTVHIQQQMGGSDCGLFAIANATALCYGKDSGTLAFDQKIMREHLRKCFAAGDLSSCVERWRKGYHTLCAPNESGCIVYQTMVGHQWWSVQSAENGFIYPV